MLDRTIIKVSYDNIIANRRKQQCPLFYNENATGYDIFLSYENITLMTQILKGGDDGIAFEAGVKPFCNTLLLPDCPELKTHDFCDSATWIHGSSNSLFCMYPIPGKVLQLRTTRLKMDVNTTFPSNTSVMFNIWEGLTTACPAYQSGVATTFGTSYPWVKVHPPADMAPQEVSVYVHLNGATPEYKVSTFKFDSLNDIITKAQARQYGSLMLMEFPYYQYDIRSLNLRSSFNDRIEIFLSNDTALDNGASTVKGEASILFKSFDEF
jgi:hypothetical protein